MDPLGSPGFTYDPEPNFTADERRRLNLFSQRMAEIEAKMREAYRQISSEADTALAQWAHFLHDYELQGKVTLFLQEVDPEYLEDDDNILADRDLYSNTPEPGSMTTTGSQILWRGKWYSARIVTFFMILLTMIRTPLRRFV